MRKCLSPNLNQFPRPLRRLFKFSRFPWPVFHIMVNKRCLWQPFQFNKWEGSSSLWLLPNKQCFNRLKCQRCKLCPRQSQLTCSLEATSNWKELIMQIMWRYVVYLESSEISLVSVDGTKIYGCTHANGTSSASRSIRSTSTISSTASNAK